MPGRPGGSAGPPRRGQRFARDTSLRRDVHTREERRSVLLVTNGSKTEMDYLNALRAEPWVTADKVTPKFVAGAPAAVVERAAQIREDNAYDQAWVVCDVDEFDVRAAVAAAAAHDDLELALSQPCFEVWLILHLGPGCPRFNSATHAGSYLKRRLAHWDKADLRFADFSPGVFDAVDRAKGLGEPPQANPSTAVWRLIESLRAAR